MREGGGDAVVCERGCVLVAKHAVDAITRVFSAELGPKKIRVNALSLGLIKTEGVETFTGGNDTFEKPTVSITPLGRIGKPDDTAMWRCFWRRTMRGVTGTVLEVAGGAR